MKKRKLKKKNLIILLILFSLIIYGGFKIIKQNNEYSKEAIDSASNYESINRLEDYKYSKTLEEILTNSLYIDNYLDEYLLIEYIEKDNFLLDINTYLSIGYNSEEINNIFLLSSINQEKLLNMNYIDFIKYIDISNYNVLNTLRYESYLEVNEYDLQTVVTYVNINLDLEFYEIVEEIDDKSSVDALVNKFNSLTSEYIPANLVSLDGYSSITINEEAGKYFTLMINAAMEDGFTFEPTSAYRDSVWQNNLYTYYVSKDGETIANTYSAKPGHSEHQTGLAIDIKNPTYYNSTGVRLNDEDYAWVLANSYKYGYIVRYPNDSEFITGYMEEPWHLRYLGVELATAVVNSGLTYDEYYDLYIKEY